jgi:hypothetical protein
MLDEIAERGVDFVFFGGDTIDYFHPEPARRVVESCEKRGLTAFFQLGNHDSEDLHSRYVSHEYEPANRQNSTHDLCSLWKMERPYYSFCRKGVRFVVADTSRYHKTPVGYAAVIEDEQKDWILSELQRGEPTVVFHHVPFNLPGLEYRLRAVWGGILACIAEDRNGLELKHAIGESAHVLGIFSAHAHIRSANPLGATCQFLTGPAHDGKWRYVEFGNRAAPKALRVQGEPHVESVRGKGKQF